MAFGTWLSIFYRLWLHRDQLAWRCLPSTCSVLLAALLPPAFLMKSVYGLYVFRQPWLCQLLPTGGLIQKQKFAL